EIGDSPAGLSPVSDGLQSDAHATPPRRQAPDPRGHGAQPLSRSLFRQEAIDAQREKYLGETTLARPVAYWVYTLLAAAIAALLLGVAIWGEYTRRERVEGHLALDV